MTDLIVASLAVAALGFFAYAVLRAIRVSTDRIVHAIDSSAATGARLALGQHYAVALTDAQRMSDQLRTGKDQT